jgi:predicted RecA/RadA family phage recombinase
MATSYISQGDVLTLPAPSGGVTAGTPVLIGRLLVIPQNTVAQTLPFDGHVKGVHAVTKADSQAWTVGANVYWDDSAKNFTTTATSNQYAGVAVEAVASTAGLVTGKILLNGIGIKAAG